MPVSLDPDRTVDYWLDSDADKPADVRPTFEFRFLSSRQLTKVRELRKRAEDISASNTATEADQERADSMRVEAIKISLVGWRNMGAETYSSDTDLGFCTPMERLEMVWKYPTRIMASEADLKNLRLPAGGQQAKSAEPATEPNPAQTPAQPSPSPSSSAMDLAPNVTEPKPDDPANPATDGGATS